MHCGTFKYFVPNTSWSLIPIDFLISGLVLYTYCFYNFLILGAVLLQVLTRDNSKRDCCCDSVPMTSKDPCSLNYPLQLRRKVLNAEHFQ